MKLCLERLSADWLEHHAHPILAVESFVDGQLTVAQILYDKGADYLLPLAGNQDGLLKTAGHLLPDGLPPSGGQDRGQPRAP